MEEDNINEYTEEFLEECEKSDGMNTNETAFIRGTMMIEEEPEEAIE